MIEQEINLSTVDYKVCYGHLTDERLIELYEAIGIDFPSEIIFLLKRCDGGVPKKSSFEYFDQYTNRKISSAIGGYLNFTKSSWSDFLTTYQSPPEFFPQGLIAFAETGGGDFICFDYRQGKDNPDPPIVYWSHGADIGRDVSFIANNFKEFIGMLKESDD